jgi:hypothetical protein
MEQEDQVKNNSRGQFQNRQDPDHQSEQHTEQNHRLEIIFLCKNLHIVEELQDLRGSIVFRRIFAAWDKVGLHDRPQRDGIDDLAGSIGEDGVHPELEGEVGVKRDILGSLLTFGQFGEDKETLPPAAFLGEHSETLNTNGKRVQVASCDTARAHRTDSKHPSVNQESEGYENTDSENPTRDSERNSGLDATAPAREGEQINSCKGIGSINGKRDKQKHPEEKVGDGCPAGVGFEIIEVLQSHS